MTLKKGSQCDLYFSQFQTVRIRRVHSALDSPQVAGSDQGAADNSYNVNENFYKIVHIILVFNCKKHGSFSTERWVFFDKWAPFLEKYPFSDVREKKFISGNFSRDLQKFSNLPKKTYSIWKT